MAVTCMELVVKIFDPCCPVGKCWQPYKPCKEPSWCRSLHRSNRFGRFVTSWNWGGTGLGHDKKSCQWHELGRSGVDCSHIRKEFAPFLVCSSAIALGCRLSVPS